MNSIAEVWKKNKAMFEGKSLSQILSFAGDGKLSDNNKTSNEFREILDLIPSSLLEKFTDNCLTDKFDDSGFALQDIINQIGVRLGFDVVNGLYRGKKNQPGYDGIWRSRDGHSIIIEVKTTDAYRINLDVIASYRQELVKLGEVDLKKSSILIVVGRQDTGDMEAQIRGSQHAWDIRLLSTDSLIKLLVLKEGLNDSRTIQQINELLKPREYTRIDKLIELIFQTSKDLQLSDSEDGEISDLEVKKQSDKKSLENDIKPNPVNFYLECIDKIQEKLKLVLIQQSRIAFASKDKSIGLTCALSKLHKQGLQEKYWFAFHPHQKDFLYTFKTGYVAFGCGTSKKLFLIPYNEFEPLVKNFWKTIRADRMYWHVVILEKDKKFFLAQPQVEKGSLYEITKYKI